MARSAYSYHLAMLPATQELIDRIAALGEMPAGERAIHRVCGSGSKDFYGTPDPGAQLLSTAALQGVVSFEPSELVVTARSGMPLEDLEALLASEGQSLPFEPPHFGGSGKPNAGQVRASKPTVGGMVAAGLSGPGRASAGAVREFVLGVQLINGRAELLQFGGTVMKNVAGYEVSRLLCGSWGTLGLLTEISLKVLPVARAQATLVFELPQAQALQQLADWGGRALPLSASCWANDRLHLRLSGAQAAVQFALKSLGGQVLAPAEANTFWRDLRDQTHAYFQAPEGGDAAGPMLWRLSVPQTAPALALPSDALVEWHGGQRWVWAHANMANEVRRAAQEVKGFASIFVANKGRGSWTNGRFEPQNRVLSTITSRMQTEFDPFGIFDRRRLAPF